MEQRFPKCGSDNLMYAVAHLLDPWSRGVLLEMKFGNMEAVKTKLVENWTKLVNNNTAPDRDNFHDAVPVGADVETVDPMEELLNLRQQRETAGNQDAGNPESEAMRNELSRFLSKPKITSNTDKLEWWRQQSDLPTLKKIAQELFAAPPSSSTSERVFSKAGQVSVILDLC